MAPSLAEQTVLAYLAKTPRLKRGSGALPGFEACGDLFVGDVEGQLALRDVEGDGVAFVDGGDGASEESLGGDVAGHEAAGGSGEAAVGEESDGVREGGDAFDGGGDGEHLAHAGAAAGAFVADDADVVGVDLAGFDGGVAVVLGVEDAGGAGVE